MNAHRLTLHLALSLGLLALLATALSGCYTPESTTRTLASGLDYPRGLTPLEDGSLLVAEVLGGRLLRVTQNGEIQTIAEGLPASFGGPAGRYPLGVSAAVEVDDVYYYVVGEFRSLAASALYVLGPGGEPQFIAGGIGRDGFPATRLTNPYDLLPHPENGFLVSDGGRNALLHVNDQGEVEQLLRFERRDHPDPEVRSRIDVVPTGIAYGPDGAVYMASFTGHPYTRGFAVVYRIEIPAANHAPAGEVVMDVYAEGLSFATDIAFDRDGSLLVTEFTTDMHRLLTEYGLDGAEALPGRLVRWREGNIEVLADDLVTPTSLAVIEDRAFVSEEFTGRISEVRLD